jgi:riboflavin kinase/FMN adenylyltransferase
MLGRSYTVRGRVARGDGRGASIGFPTANLDPENEVLPAAGVYAGWVRLLDAGAPAAGARFPAVTNVGLRPTFGPGGPLRAEAHLIGFTGDVYGRRVDLSFERRLRPEQRFDGVAALRAQIAADVDAARRLLGAT